MSTSLETSFDDSHLFTQPTMRKYKFNEYLVELWVSRVYRSLQFNLALLIKWLIVSSLYFFDVIQSPIPLDFVKYDLLNTLSKISVVILTIVVLMGFCIMRYTS